MRNLTTCDADLHPSTVASEFERGMLQDVLPNAGERPLPHGALFVRSLYRAAGDEFPPAYRCVVNTTLVSDAGFFGMRRGMHLLGADATDPRFRVLAGALPSDEAALATLQDDPGHTLVMLTAHVPLRLIQESFEKELRIALSGEVGVATRVNNVHAAFWTRNDSVLVGRVEYQLAVLGHFLRPHLRDDTLKQIQAAGGEVFEPRVFHHVGTVAGDPAATAG
jgi:hypothetical protein